MGNSQGSADVVTPERLAKYAEITRRALEKARAAPTDRARRGDAHIVLDMAQRYADDALYFERKGDLVTAFAALNYAHGWLDAGARLGLFKVDDSTLFTVDGK